MRLSSALGVVGGIVIGFTGLFLLGFMGPNPCTAVGMVINDARNSPSYGRFLGFECDRWPTVAEGLVLEVLPLALILSMAGAFAARIGEQFSPLRGALTGAFVGGVGYLLRAVAYSGQFSTPPKVAAIYGPLAIVVGLALGWAGSVWARRFP